MTVETKHDETAWAARNCWVSVRSMSYYESRAVTFEGKAECEAADVGRWKVVLLPRYVTEEELVEAADEVSGEAWIAAEAWAPREDDLGAEATGSHILLVEEIIVHEDYRGHGGGRAILRALIRSVGYGAGIVLMRPAPMRRTGEEPLPKAEWTAAQEKLTDYWLRVCPGFQKLGDPEGHLWLDLGLQHDWIDGEAE